MKSKYLTDEQVESEIDRLNKSPLVKLAQKEIRVRYKRRQVLYNLRTLERQGKRLQEAGITFEMLDAQENSLTEVEQ